MGRREILEADLTWTGARFERGVRLAIEDGRIAEHDGSPPTLRLNSRALLPGFVNAHSHAFQRGLRGRSEVFARGPGSFWTWRERMYELAAEIDAARLRVESLRAFREMLAAGITSVGEFHYLHRSPEGDELDRVVLNAAAEAGIRIVLLNAYYRTGGIGQPLSQIQQRFASISPKAYWERLERLEPILEPSTQSLGSVVHSIRASSLEDLAAIHAESRRRGLVFHMHVEEQEREVEECRAAYGKTPMELILERLEVDARFTAVHCTRTEPAELRRFVGNGATVCLCPLTEASLADGIANVPLLLELGARLCVGTDSNARICMAEELRWLEYAQRLALRRRGVLSGSAGDLARGLLEMATLNGARSLGLDAGRIAPGALADFAAIDLEAPVLEGWSEETLLPALLFGTGNEAIAGSCVGGVWR